MLEQLPQFHRGLAVRFELSHRPPIDERMKFGEGYLREGFCSLVDRLADRRPNLARSLVEYVEDTSAYRLESSPFGCVWIRVGFPMESGNSDCEGLD